jgi:SOS-response transcriptional repressor LexA
MVETGQAGVPRQNYAQPFPLIDSVRVGHARGVSSCSLLPREFFDGALDTPTFFDQGGHDTLGSAPFRADAGDDDAGNAKTPRNPRVNTFVVLRPEQTQVRGGNLSGVNNVNHQPRLYNRKKDLSRTILKKVASRPKAISDPGSVGELPARLKQLRTLLGYNQAQLAAALGVSQAAVSKWHVGMAEPSAESYSRLAQMTASEDLARYFMDRAIELTPSLRGLLDDARAREARAREAEKKEPKKVVRRSSVEIPVLNGAIAAGQPRLVRDHDYEDVLTLPSAWVPHPEHTRCIKVAGDSMSPTVEDGYMIVVDTYRQEPRDLNGKMVVARDPEGNCTVKWLRRVGKEFMLVPQHTSPRHNPVIMREDPRWRLLGVVLFWIGKPE